MNTANTIVGLTKNSPDGVNLHKCVSGGSTLQTCESEQRCLRSAALTLCLVAEQVIPGKLVEGTRIDCELDSPATTQALTTACRSRSRFRMQAKQL